MLRLLSQLLVLTLLLLLTLINSQKPLPPYLISVQKWQRTYGVWDSWITAQDNPELPPMYFVCGVAYQEMIWKKNMSSGCPSSCSFSLQTFKSMVNAVKITYCHYSDWNKQIVKTFATGNSTANCGAFREYKCPRDSFITKASSKFGFEYENDLGMNGILFVCENMNLDGTPTTVEDPSKASFTTPLQGPPKHGFFMSAIIFKYEVNGKLAGINFGYSAVPEIIKMVIEYGETSDNMMRKVEETSETENRMSYTMQTSKDYNKSIATNNFFVNELPSTYDYGINKNVIIEQFELWQGILIPDMKRQLNQSNFSFNTLIQSQKQITQSVCLQIGPCKSVQLVTEINLNNASTAYTVVITFANRMTGELIGTTSKIKGFWKGTLVESVRSKTIENVAENCPAVSNNLKTQ